MSWFGWRDPDDFNDDGLTDFERAQVRAMQEVVREYEAKSRAYHSLLYWLATRIAPEAVDRRLTKNPFAFADLSPEAWRRFFEKNLQRVHLSHGLAPITPALERENERLRQQLAAAEAQIAELQAERDRLQQSVIVLRRESQSSTEIETASPEPEHVKLPIPDEPPPEYDVLFSPPNKPKARRREVAALAIMAGTGYSAEASLRWEIVQFCQGMVTPRDIKEGKVPKNHDSGSIKRIFLRLEEKNLLQRLVISVGQNRIVIIRLTDLGRSVVRAMGVPIVESEWERLMRLHGGERQQKHAAQVCLFTHYARKRGWRTEVCPKVDPPADPDALIEKDGKRIYVEVEAGSGTPERRMKKWRNQRNLQGFVALCAPSESIRRTLVNEARSNTKKGMATDFLWLRENDHGLWAETW